jgi:hypothetical protein
MPFVADFVEALQEIDRVEILPAAVDVRHPLTGFARVVEVEHRRDGIHTEPIDVIFGEPEESV